MKLDSKKNILLMQKGLYAEQLKHYTSLCQTYVEFLKKTVVNPSGKITEQNLKEAQLRYASYLSYASKGDLSFLDRRDFTPEEVELFKIYQYHSLKLEQFRTGSTILERAIDHDTRTNKTYLSSGALMEFDEFMKKPLDIESPEHIDSPGVPTVPVIETYSEEKNISYSEAQKQLLASRKRLLKVNGADFLVKNLLPNHSPRWLGHYFFSIAKSSLKTIESIDPSHLPEDLQLPNALTPSQFGAEITGCKEDIDELFTDKEQDKYEKQPKKLHESAYRLYDSTLGSLSRSKKALIALGLSSALALGLGGKEAIDVIQEGNTFDDTLATLSQSESDKKSDPRTPEQLLSDLENVIMASGYNSALKTKKDVIGVLDSTIQTIDNLLQSNKTPSFEDVSRIIDVLDNSIDLSLESSITAAVKERYPDYTDITSDVFYDDTVRNPDNFDEVIPTQGIRISAKDKNGNPVHVTLDEISSPFTANDLFEELMNLERTLDFSTDEGRKYKMLIESLKDGQLDPKTGTPYTYEQRADNATELLKLLKEDCVTAKKAAIPSISIDDKGNFEFVVPTLEKETTAQKGTVSEDGKTYYDDNGNPHEINPDAIQDRDDDR